MCPTPRRCRGFQSSRILLQGVALKGRQIQPCHGRGFNFRGLYRSKTINQGTEPFSKSSLDKAGTQFSWNWPICYFGEQLCPGLNDNMKKFKVLLRGIFSPSGSRTRLRGTTWTFQGSIGQQITDMLRGTLVPLVRNQARGTTWISGRIAYSRKLWYLPLTRWTRNQVQVFVRCGRFLGIQVRRNG